MTTEAVRFKLDPSSLILHTSSLTLRLSAHCLPATAYCFLAFRARAQLVKIAKAVNPCRVAVAPRDAHRVAAHQFCLLGLQGLFVNRQNARLRGRLRGGTLARAMRIRTSGARALLAQVGVRVKAAVAVRPFHSNAVVLGCEFYPFGSWHRKGVRCQVSDATYSITISSATT